MLWGMDNEQIDVKELAEMGRRRRQGDDVEVTNYFEKIHHSHIEYKRKHKVSGLIEMNKVLLASLHYHQRVPRR
jgi:hypothetical protein